VGTNDILESVNLCRKSVHRTRPGSNEHHHSTHTLCLSCSTSMGIRLVGQEDRTVLVVQVALDQAVGVGVGGVMVVRVRGRSVSRWWG
jgi:hypothetical protein